jgi:hypothetical protein
MCFSAEASFAAGAALLPAGIYCTSVAARKRPAYLPLAVIPIVQLPAILRGIGMGRPGPG